MINREFIILRSPRSASLGDPFSGPNAFPSTGPGSPIPGSLGENRGESTRTGSVGVGREIQIEIEQLAKRDIVDLQRDPEVESIAPAIPTKLIEPRAGTANVAISAEDDSTWGVEATKAAQSPYSGAGILVAVLDTGIDAEHSAFGGVELNQRDFTGEGDGDSNGHGTHVAGSIFGRTVSNSTDSNSADSNSADSNSADSNRADSNRAVAGIRYSIAPGIERALIGKVLQADGGGTTDMIYQAILWAVDNGAQLINMSLGFDFPGLVTSLSAEGVPTNLATSWALESYRSNLRLFDRLAALISARAAFGMGTLIIAAAGNESSREINPEYEIAVSPPAAADGILAVGALESSGKPHSALTIADFSNTGANVCGPGVDILSAQLGGGFGTLSGTSMASPHVTGIAALWAEKMVTDVGFFNPNRVTADLISRATTEILAPNYDPLDVGAGMVQAPLA